MILERIGAIDPHGQTLSVPFFGSHFSAASPIHSAEDHGSELHVTTFPAVMLDYTIQIASFQYEKYTLLREEMAVW